MKARELRVGLIGAGGISRVHCEGWSKTVGAQMVAVSDINTAAARQRADEYKFNAIEPTSEALIARDDIDVIDICAPNRFHKGLAVAALLAGKHVLCEKPLALSVREVDQMIAASEKSGKKLMAGHHMRFQNDSMAIREYLSRHRLGEVYYVRAWYNRRRLLPCTPGFMYKRNSGGGCLIDVGVHVLDLAMHLMDNFAPVSVSGVSLTKLAKRPGAWSEWGQIDRRNLDVEDFAAGLVRFANGAALSLECSFMLNMKPHYENRIDLFGTEAGASWPGCEYHDHTSNGYVDAQINILKAPRGAHHEEIVQFAKAVVDDKPVPVPPRQTRAVIAVLEGLYKSQKTGHEVKLKP